MKTQFNYDVALKQADHIVHLNELTFNTMLHKIAKAMIQFHGFYAYTDKEENLKIFVKP